MRKSYLLGCAVALMLSMPAVAAHDESGVNASHAAIVAAPPLIDADTLTAFIGHDLSGIAGFNSPQGITMLSVILAPRESEHARSRHGLADTLYSKRANKPLAAIAAEVGGWPSSNG